MQVHSWISFTQGHQKQFSVQFMSLSVNGAM
uniref:Uncharacterized protein n=1 Tax=Anguilla anguilla TaxID=7936 RepID=A0A0E9T5P2_ANGAN